jgi:hypothetical protein
MPGLDSADLVRLVQSVFPRFPEDSRLGILVDVPRDPAADNHAWKARRVLAAEWAAALKKGAASVPLDAVDLIAYPDVGSNNADLPSHATLIRRSLPEAADGLAAEGYSLPFLEVFRTTQILLAPTEFSTTAPLKNAAKAHGFRAATMPGFSDEMLPALRIDYAEVARRTALLKERLDRAEGADVVWTVDGKAAYAVRFDLRNTSAHLSSGRFPERGTAGNLPSGEIYIVPFEGGAADASRTVGRLPVQIGPDIIVFRIAANTAVEAEGEGSAADAERDHLRREPAYGNMAELGFGVLGDFGLRPIGEILLDEKLGLHVAFGRSDHFGGRVGPGSFSNPREVIHLDRIYIPETQPRISVRSVVFDYGGGARETVMEDGRYRIF